MAFHVIDGINIYKNLVLHDNTLNGVDSILASGDIAAGSITTSSGNISSYSGNVQTRGIVGGKNGTSQTLACTGLETVTVPESRGIFMGLDSDAAGGIDICADTANVLILQHCFFILQGKTYLQCNKQ